MQKQSLKKQKILAIESSCDETSIAIIQKMRPDSGNYVSYLNSFDIFSNIVSSQIATHAHYGGVVPEIGARLHAQQIHELFCEALGLDIHCSHTDLIQSISDIDLICATTQPGLASALRVGQEFAKTLQYFIQLHTKKLVQIRSIHHLAGHVASAFYNEQAPKLDDKTIFPHLHAIVSGGNTQLLLMTSPTEWSIIGQTIDDAAGECLDKIGRMLGFSYPGGVSVAKTAGLVEENILSFPIAMKHKQTLDVSYSGLKTAVRLYLQRSMVDGYEFEAPLSEQEKSDLLELPDLQLSEKLQMIRKVCVSSQYAAVEQLTHRIQYAIHIYRPQSLGMSGGVSANLLFRKRMADFLLPLFIPPLSLTGDNAVMIALRCATEEKYKR
jgi:N6-L-threonylcarbamoyladenine synthase